MNYRGAIRLIIVALAIQIVTVMPRADGCFVWRWNKQADINEPNQKAIILHDAGREDMLLQVKFEGAAEDFGWLVPVPSLPTVQRGSMDAFYELSKLTQGTVQYATAGTMSAGGGHAEPRVKVIETKTVGAYEISILSALDAGSLESWLKENGYAIPGGNSGRDVVEDYIRRGWFFVAAKIDLKGTGFKVIASKAEHSSATAKKKQAIEKELASGELHPLLISFDTPKCIFPLKISSVAGKPSELSLYVISEEPLLNKWFFSAARDLSRERRRNGREWLEDVRLNGFAASYSPTPRSKVRAEDLEEIRREYTSVRKPSLDEQFEFWGTLEGLNWFSVKPKQISKTAKSIPRLNRRNWWVGKIVWTVKPEEMRDLEFVPATPILSEQLKGEDGYAAAWILKRLGTNGMQVFIQAAQSSNSTERANAVLGFERHVAERIEVPQYVETLLALLQDSQPIVRLHATQAAAQHWDPRFLDPVSALLRDSNEEVRSAAVRCIQWHDGQGHAARYLAMLREQDARARHSALQVLDESNYVAAIPTETLRDCLKDPDPDVQNEALKIFIRSRSQALTREELLPVLKSSRMETVMMALHSIDERTPGLDRTRGRMVPGETLSTAEAEILASSPLAAARSWAPGALQRNRDEKAFELMLRLLRDPNGLVRARAFVSMRAMAGENISDNDPVAWENWWKTNSVARARAAENAKRP